MYKFICTSKLVILVDRQANMVTTTKIKSIRNHSMQPANYDKHTTVSVCKKAVFEEAYGVAKESYYLEKLQMYRIHATR